MYHKGLLDNNAHNKEQKQKTKCPKFSPTGFEPTHMPDKGLPCKMAGFQRAFFI